MRILKFAAVVLLVIGISVQAFSQRNSDNNLSPLNLKNSYKRFFYVYLPESQKAAAESLLKFAVRTKRNFKCSFLTLNNLAMAAKSTDMEALDCLHSLLVSNELNGTRSDYFNQITAEANNSAILSLRDTNVGL
jgi:hypothetical protein